MIEEAQSGAVVANIIEDLLENLLQDAASSGIKDSRDMPSFEGLSDIPPCDRLGQEAANELKDCWAGPDAAFYLSAIQGLLFVAGRPISATEAARALQIDAALTALLLQRLVNGFQPGGLQVVAVAGGYQMTTMPEHARLISRFLEPPPQRLSNAALETLALIAYRQPLTLPEIEAVRGVQSDSSVRTLLERGLIEDSGRKEVIGRPILYRTTADFLLYLGINELSELPPMEECVDE
ncbi:MAG TPA: SMC-Scp complex subunit ScpB [Armatimonadota bacterium]|nr:SMC-Scp complex subunit ScpB [Armatimonadota bacterium]